MQGMYYGHACADMCVYLRKQLEGHGDELREDVGWGEVGQQTDMVTHFFSYKDKLIPN